MNRSRLLALVETAVMVALAVLLASIKVYKLPQGGSITAGSMVPILLVALRHGPGWGTLAGVATGLINYIMDPFFAHPVQFILDYPVAFGALGLAGFAANRGNTAAAWIGSLALGGRFLAHVVSGAVFFAEYAPKGQSPWVYSAVYNGSYMLPELVISGVLLTLVLPALSKAAPTELRKSA